MNNTENRKIIIALLVMLISVFIWGALYYITNVEAQLLAQNKAQLSVMSEWKSDFTVIDSQLKRTNLNRKLLAEQFYSEDEILKFIELLESFADRAQLSIEISKIDTIDSLKTNILIEGDYDKTIKFLNFLENAPVIMDLHKIILKEIQIVDEEGQETTIWSGVIEVTLLNSKV